MLQQKIIHVPAMTALVLSYLNEIISKKNVTAQNFKLSAGDPAE